MLLENYILKMRETLREREREKRERKSSIYIPSVGVGSLYT